MRVSRFVEFSCTFAIMFSYKNLLIAVVVTGSLASCKVFKTIANSPVTMPELVVSAENNPLDIYRATATKSWELVHTGIDIHFRLRERVADATASLTLHPYFYASDSVVLDAKGMKILEVKDAQGLLLSYQYDTLQLKIRLQRVYQKEDTLRLTVKYTAMPYAFESVGTEAIHEDRGLYFINTDGAEPYKPVQIWTQGESEASSHWFPTFDKPNFRSTFAITMHVPDTFKSLSNGLLVKSVKEPNGLRADTWQQNIPIPPYLVMMAAGNYHVATETWKGKEVSYYVPQAYAAYAKDIFNHTPEMIGFYSELLGVDFPWDKYSQVIGYDYVSGAMENVSASLFGAFNLKDTRELADDNNDYIVAHELFHQWFGDYVTAESWSNLTLNESFADYGEYLWAEHKYGKVAMQHIWCKGLEKYLNQTKWSDPSLVRFYYRNEGDMFDRVSYSKGGLILHYLRQLTGDKAFFEALNLYLRQNALHSAEAHQLRLAFEQVTGKDWTWFFNQWYYKGGHPQLDVRYQYDDTKQKVTVIVKQLQPEATGLYRLPLKAQLLYNGQIKELDWELTRKTQQWEYDYENGQRPVIIPDAGHWLPGELTDNKNTEQWKAQYQLSKDVISKRLALTALSRLKNNDTAEQVLLTALKDTDPVLRKMAVEAKSYEGNTKLSKEWINTLGKMSQDDPDAKVRASALKALGDLRNESYTTIYEQSLSDRSYKVAAAGLYALDRVNHNRAVEMARALKPETLFHSSLLYTAAEVIATDGKKDDYTFYENTLLHLMENDRLSFLPAVQEYLVHVKDEQAFQKGINLLKALALREVSGKSALYIGGFIFNVKNHAAKEAKIATDRALIEDWKHRSAFAAGAWDEYKKSVKDVNLKADIDRMEKENQ